MARRVLIIDGDSDLQMALRGTLEVDGYDVLSAETGEFGLELVLKEQPDLMILDLMLPKMSGVEVCRKVRAAQPETRIIMLSARNTEHDRIAGLDCGADDFIGKPFSPDELKARVRAQLRHHPANVPRPTDVTFGNVTIDLVHREVRGGSRSINLTTREFDLLQYFVLHQGEVLTRERLLRDVWGYGTPVVTRTLDNFVARLRKYIEPDPLHPRHLLTVHGSGYRLEL